MKSFAVNTNKSKANKALVLLLALLFVLMTLTGCGGNDDEEDVAVAPARYNLSADVKICTSSDVLYDVEVLKMMEGDYQLTQGRTEAEVIDKLKSGVVDVAIITPYGAAQLYHETGNIEVICPVFLGGYSFQGAGEMELVAPERELPTTRPDMEEPKEDNNHTQQAVPVAPAPQVSAKSSNAPISFYDTTGQTQAMIAAISNTMGVSMTSVPVADVEKLDEKLSGNSVVLANIYDVTNTSDTVKNAAQAASLDQFWQDAYGQPIPAAVMVVRTSFADYRPNDVKCVIQDYGLALAEYESPYPDGQLVFYEKTNRGNTILKDFYKAIFYNNEELIPDSKFYYY